MRQSVVQVDAFTDRPFRGNPAAVCVLAEPWSDERMRDVAAEMNLSETAFVTRAGNEWSLRWFTPTVEVDLCGHATLAAAHVLWEDGGGDPAEAIVFHTRGGALTARRDAEWITLDFPAKPIEAPLDAAQLSPALPGVEAVFTGRSAFDWLVELDSEEAVRQAAPDFAALAGLPARGLIITARAEREDADFVSRFFAPRVGVDEDPVTGSAHCVLAPYWAAKLGRAELTGRQLSRRGGVVRVRTRGGRVDLAGRAVTVLRGELLLP